MFSLNQNCKKFKTFQRAEVQRIKNLVKNVELMKA